MKLFWKKMPNKTFISENENSASGFKAAKDKVIFQLSSNTSKECLIKPLMLYRSLNPHAWKNQNQDNPPLFWCAKHSLVISTVFCDFLKSVFQSNVLLLGTVNRHNCRCWADNNPKIFPICSCCYFWWSCPRSPFLTRKFN